MKIKIPPIPKDKIQIVVLGVLMVVLISVLGGMFLIVPGFAKKRVLMKEYLENNEQLKKDERMVAKKGNLSKSLKKLKLEFGEMAPKIPHGSGKFSILSLLNEKGQETLVLFDRIEPKEVPEEEKTPILGFVQKDYFLKFRGGYHQLGTFLNKLENASPFIQIRDIKIYGVKEQPELHEITLTVRCLVGV